MIGRSIRKFRKQKKLRLEDVAQACGVTAVTISRYERGEREPSADMLRDIAGALGVTVEEINQLAAELAPASSADSDNSPKYVSNDIQLTDWTKKLIEAGPDNPNLLLVLLVLARYLDRTAWVVSGTIPEIAQSASLPVGLVEDMWPDVLASPFIERVGSGEWTLRLVFPEASDS